MVPAVSGSFSFFSFIYSFAQTLQRRQAMVRPFLSWSERKVTDKTQMAIGQISVLVARYGERMCVHMTLRIWNEYLLCQMEMKIHSFYYHIWNVYLWKGIDQMLFSVFNFGRVAYNIGFKMRGHNKQSVVFLSFICKHAPIHVHVAWWVRSGVADGDQSFFSGKSKPQRR